MPAVEYYLCVKAQNVKHSYKHEPSWDTWVIETPWFSEVKFGVGNSEEKRSLLLKSARLRCVVWR